MNLSYPLFQHFIQKHGKDNLFDIINTILNICEPTIFPIAINTILNEFDSNILINFDIPLEKYVQFIFAIATAKFLNFDDYKRIILLNSSSKDLLLYDYFKSINAVKLHSKSISKIIFFLKQDFPNL